MTISEYIKSSFTPYEIAVIGRILNFLMFFAVLFFCLSIGFGIRICDNNRDLFLFISWVLDIEPLPWLRQASRPRVYF